MRKPPIVDVDGTLLDGNRRVTACYHILEDDTGEFTADEKQRADWLKVWQLTDHATEQDREAVIVSLNFEPDFKQDWPEYVKAQKVYDQWETLLSLEPRANPGTARVREIRHEIARKFALSTNEVSRYISMVGLAREFEDYQVVERSKDPFAAKHRASDKFQYFDELNKGKGAGGVYWSLNQEGSFKHLVFDLLYDGKFKSWQKIRDLKYIYQNEDAVSVLRKAHNEPDVGSCPGRGRQRDQPGSDGARGAAADGCEHEDPCLHGVVPRPACQSLRPECVRFCHKGEPEASPERAETCRELPRDGRRRGGPGRWSLTAA